ncbi:hypothetical protein [Xaviernesmea oryzae]|nr:hypothetical protein [Xaviernesmea oryzae]
MPEFNKESHAGEAVRPPALAFDYERYKGQVEDFDMTDDQKRELLETLWSIMKSFVELGFSAEHCGQILATFNIAAEDASDAVESADFHETETPARQQDEEA